MFKIFFLPMLFVLPCIASANTLQVSPSSLGGLPNQELGQVVLKFMPDKSGTIGWATNANDNSFKWIDRKFVETILEDNTVRSSRRALYRGNVNGVRSTFLGDRMYEMPWLITMNGEGLGKFGVDSVSFYPFEYADKEDDSGICFGTTHENCNFKPFESLKKAGITYKKICEDHIGSGNFDIVYLLSKQGKKNTYGIWSESTGSGGSSSMFELDYSNSNAEVCKKIK